MGGGVWWGGKGVEGRGGGGVEGRLYIHNEINSTLWYHFYSMLPVKNIFMYLAIMCQPVEDGSCKASYTIFTSH